MVTLIKGERHATYTPIMERLLDYDEADNPEKSEAYGTAYNAEIDSPPLKPAKTGNGGGLALKKALGDGDFSGITPADVHAYLSDYNKRRDQRTTLKVAPVNLAKGKSHGKGSFKPRDRTNDTCSNCDKKGHWAPDCKEPRREFQAQNRPVGFVNFSKGKGKGKGKGGKNPAKKVAPY